MDLENLPVIDWDQATQLAGGKKEYAEEMLALLLNSLPSDMSAINSCHSEQNHPELLRRVHKLHGALCYTGLPRLKTLIQTLESNLKNNIMDSSPLLIEQLNLEYNQLLNQCSSRSRSEQF